MKQTLLIPLSTATYGFSSFSVCYPRNFSRVHNIIYMRECVLISEQPLTKGLLELF